LNESQWIDVGAGGTDAAIAKLVEAVGRHLVPGSAADPARAPQLPVRKVAPAGRCPRSSLFYRIVLHHQQRHDSRPYQSDKRG
jgi:hypothetical protein